MRTANNPGRVAYDYALKCYDVMLAAHVRVAERANKLIVVQALLFAALSFGLTNLGWLVTHRPANAGWPFWVSFWTGAGAGLIAGLVLALSFYAALNCQRLEKLHIPSTRWVAVHPKESYFLRWADDKLLACLACNVRKAIQRNIQDEATVEKWAGRLNRTLLVAFVFTAVFLATTNVQRVVLSATNGSPVLAEDHTMPEDEKESEAKEDEAASTEEDVIEEPEMVIGKRDNGDRQAKTTRRDDLRGS